MNQRAGNFAEGMSRRSVLRRVGGGIAAGSAIAVIARIDASAASIGAPASHNTVAAQVTPAAGGDATPAADLTYGGRSISYVQEGNAVMIVIDGVPVDMVAFHDPAYVVSPEIAAFATPGAGEATPAFVFVGGQFFSMYFPFQGYDSIDELSRALVDYEGKTWTLNPNP
jgi:hypothetical protein